MKNSNADVFLAQDISFVMWIRGVWALNDARFTSHFCNLKNHEASELLQMMSAKGRVPWGRGGGPILRTIA